MLIKPIKFKLCASSSSSWRKTWNVNILSVYLCCSLCIIVFVDLHLTFKCFFYYWQCKYDIQYTINVNKLLRIVVYNGKIAGYYCCLKKCKKNLVLRDLKTLLTEKVYYSLKFVFLQNVCIMFKSFPSTNNSVVFFLIPETGEAVAETGVCCKIGFTQSNTQISMQIKWSMVSIHGPLVTGPE